MSARLQKEGDGVRYEQRQTPLFDAARSRALRANGYSWMEYGKELHRTRTRRGTYNEVKAGVRKTVKDSDVHQIARCHGRFCSKLVMGLIPLLGGAMLVSASLLEQAGTAEIVDSGSTNTSGFRIVVDRSGQADYKTTTRKNAPQTDERSVNKHRQISRELVDRFYSDLEAAKPLSSLPEQRCMKSASFGTTMSIEFAGEKTPDLNCGDGGDPKLQAIIRDTNDIVQLFGTNEHVAPPRKPQ